MNYLRHLLYIFNFSSSINYKIRYIISLCLKGFWYLLGKGIHSDYFFGSGRFVIKNKFGTFEIQEPSDMHAILSESFEQSLITYFTASKGSIFLDIGANVGKYSIYMARQGYHVHSFEPNALTYKYLKKNISLNHKMKGSVFAHNYGLGNKDQEIVLYYPKGNMGVARNKNIRSGSKEKIIEASIQIHTFDYLIKNNSLNTHDIGLVKIDVEGAELSVLLGMQAFLHKINARFIIEIIQDKKEIIEIMKKNGYKIVFTDNLHNFVFDKVNVLYN